MALGRDPLIPARTRVEAYSVACRWAERKARLLGLDSQVAVIGEDLVDAEIARFTAERGRRSQD